MTMAMKNTMITMTMKVTEDMMIMSIMDTTLMTTMIMLVGMWITDIIAGLTDHLVGREVNLKFQYITAILMITQEMKV